MIKVSIIIPNYNGEKYLAVCLRSLLAQTFKDFELIIVENASDDKSLDIIKDYAGKFESLKIIQNIKNEGFARAVNQGIKAARGEYAALLNNDTEAEPDWLFHLVKAIEEDNRIFSVAGKMLRYNDREIIDDAGDQFTILGWAYKRGDGRHQSRYNNKAQIFSSCAGAALYRISIFQEIGYFDENFFAYLEDVDIGYRARIYGYINCFCPQAIVYHVGSATSGSQHNAFKVRISSRNSIYLIKKNMPLLQLTINSPILFIGFLIKGLFFLYNGFGKDYIYGLGEGIVSRAKQNKDYSQSSLKKNKTTLKLKNYLWLEVLLIINLIKFIGQRIT